MVVVVAVVTAAGVGGGSREPKGLRGTLALDLRALLGPLGSRWASICYGRRQVSVLTRLLGSMAMAKS